MDINLYLKPCPFCGRDLEDVSFKYNPYAEIVESLDATCHRCGIHFSIDEIHKTLHGWNGPDDAVDIWNRRVKEENMADKFVDFYTYCKACKHKDKNENDDPCNDCLNEPVNEDSHKPWYFEAEDE